MHFLVILDDNLDAVQDAIRISLGVDNARAIGISLGIAEFDVVVIAEELRDSTVVFGCNRDLVFATFAVLLLVDLARRAVALVLVADVVCRDFLAVA